MDRPDPSDLRKSAAAQPPFKGGSAALAHRPPTLDKPHPHRLTSPHLTENGVFQMSDLTIHNFSKDLQQRLNRRAARQGRSAEAEALEILREAVKGEAKKRRDPEKGLASEIRARVMKHGGYDFDPPQRDRTPLILPPPISDE